MTQEKRRSAVVLGLQRRAVFSLVVALVLVGGGGAWAATAELDGASLASGTLTIDGDLRNISHPSGGRVAAVLVEEGETVTADQVLVQLSNLSVEKELAAAAPGIDALTIRIARLTAESEGRDSFEVVDGDLLAPTSPQTLSVLQSERDVLSHGREVADSQSRLAHGRIDQYQREIDRLETNEANLVEQLAQARADLTSVGQLPPEQANPTLAANLQEGVSQVEAQLESVRASIASTKTSLAAEKEQQTSVASNNELSAAQSIPSALRDREALQARRDQLIAEAAALEIKSPVDGVVNELGVHGAGEVVQPGANVAQVVPTGAKLVATIKVALTEIDVWKPGDLVLLRFPGLPTEATPETWATVAMVSAAPSADPRTGVENYVAQVSLEDGDLPASLRSAFVPGMPVEAQLKLGRRTVLSYLIKPVADRFAQALKEE